MKLDKDSRCASFVREGDYFVVRTGIGGSSFDYSPDASPDARIIGAFVTGATHVNYMDSQRANALFSQFGAESEDHLLSVAKLEDARRHSPKREGKEAKPDLQNNLLRGLGAMAAGMKGGQIWEGSMSQFFDDLATIAVPEVKLTWQLRKAVANIIKENVGISRQGAGIYTRLIVDWDQLSLLNDSEKI